MNLSELIINCTPDNKVTLTCKALGEWRAVAFLKPIMARESYKSNNPVMMEGRGVTPVDALYSLARTFETELWKFDKAVNP